VSYSGKLSGLKAFKFVEERVNHDNIAYRTDSVAGAAAAIAAGLGLGYLPCMLGDLSPDLVRAGAVEPELNDQLWLLTHPLRGTTSGRRSEAEISSTSFLFQTAQP
jgi:DNA-binding transcriptional LysR family regulator